MVFVLACCHARATLERALERSETVKAHLIGNAGYRAIIGPYALLGVIDPQYGEPVSEAHPDLLVKKSAEISALKPGDIRSPLQADILVIMLFAKRGQVPQLRIVRKCGVAYVARSTIAQLCDLPPTSALVQDEGPAARRSWDLSGSLP